MSKRDVSPEIKEPRKQSKMPKKPLWFSTEKEKRLLYVTHQKKSIHTPAILLRHLDVSRKKKIKPEIIDCAPPEKHPNP